MSDFSTSASQMLARRCADAYQHPASEAKLRLPLRVSFLAVFVDAVVQHINQKANDPLIKLQIAQINDNTTFTVAKIRSIK